MAGPEIAYTLRDPQSLDIFILDHGVWSGDDPEAVDLLNKRFGRSRPYSDDPGRYLPDPDWQLARDAQDELGLVIIEEPVREPSTETAGRVY
jgi:hypothetical protein